MVNKGWLREAFENPEPKAAANPAVISYETFGLTGGGTGTGINVTPEKALMISTVWACVGLIADCVGMLPLLTYRYLSDGGRERATNHPLYDVLHLQFNNKQTAIESKSMMTGHLLLRGNAFGRILPGPRGFADQIVPLHPDYVTTEPLSDGGMRYRVQTIKGQETLNDEDVLHLKGLSVDGLNGLSVVSYARESFGLALAEERSGAKTLGQGSRPSGVLTTKGKLSPEGAKRMKASWQEAQAGINNDGKVALLEEGLEFQAMGLSNKDSQWLESREFQAEDICRWFRMPPHMVGLTSKATSWGSGIEQMGIGFVTYTLQPWLTRWEQAITRDLILAPKTYFVEFLVDALLRGDLKGRYDAYQIAINNGWLSSDEIRARENLNPLPDGQGQKYYRPLNMQEVGAPVPVAPIPQPTTPPTNGNAHYVQLLQSAAGRIMRKEIAAISKLAKHTEQGDLWVEGVKDFYSDHAQYVAQTLRIDVDKAQIYVNEQMGQLVMQGAAVMADWESRRVNDLVQLALEVTQ